MKEKFLLPYYIMDSIFLESPKRHTYDTTAILFKNFMPKVNLGQEQTLYDTKPLLLSKDSEHIK